MSSWEDKKERAKKLMIQKLYPNFDERSQYVFWCVFDLFHKYYYYRTDAKIEIIKKDGSLLTVVGEPMVRTPYPNKKISQVGVKKGRSRVYGVPIVFNTLDEIQEIDKVRVYWTVYKPISVNHESFIKYGPNSINIETILIEYNVSFDTDEKEHYYILTSYDNFIRDVDTNSHQEKHLSNYDVVVGYNGDYIYDGDIDDDVEDILEGKWIYHCKVNSNYNEDYGFDLLDGIKLDVATLLSLYDKYRGDTFKHIWGKNAFESNYEKSFYGRTFIVKPLVSDYSEGHFIISSNTGFVLE